MAKHARKNNFSFAHIERTANRMMEREIERSKTAFRKGVRTVKRSTQFMGACVEREMNEMGA